MASTPILTFASRIEAGLSQLLLRDKNLLLVHIDNNHVALTHCIRERYDIQFKEIETTPELDKMAVVCVLNSAQYIKKEVRYTADEELFDTDIWIDDHKRETFPTGLNRKNFHIHLEKNKKRNIVAVFLISLSLLDKVEQKLAANSYATLLLTGKENNKKIIYRGILSGTPPGILINSSAIYQPLIKDQVQRWILVFLLALLLLFGLNAISGTATEYFYSAAEKELLAYSSERSEETSLKREKQRLSQVLADINWYRGGGNDYGVKINTIMRRLPRAVWVKKIGLGNSVLQTELYTSDISRVDRFSKEIEGLSFVLDVATASIKNITNASVKKEYRVRGKLYQVTLKVKIR